MTEPEKIMSQLSSVKAQIEILESKVKQGDGNLSSNLSALNEQVRRLWGVVFEGDDAYDAKPLTEQVAANHKAIARIENRWDTIIERFNGVKLTIKFLVAIGIIEAGGIAGLIGLFLQKAP